MLRQELRARLFQLATDLMHLRRCPKSLEGRPTTFFCDPCMDESVLTEFAGSLQEFVQLRLLTGQATLKPSLAPAVLRWKTQFTNRPVEARLAPPLKLTSRNARRRSGSSPR